MLFVIESVCNTKGLLYLSLEDYETDRAMREEKKGYPSQMVFN